MPAKSLRVLILENQSFQRAIALKILGHLGCRDVWVASGGNEALALLAHVGPVDVVVCDVRMEGMDGLEFIHRAAQARLIAGVVLSSGLHSEMRRCLTRLFDRLGVAFLGDVGKPLRLEAMRDALGRLRSRVPLLACPAPQVSDIDEAQIRRGLSYKELEACYLPRCDLGNGEILGVDVIAQWNHPEKGVLAPNLFMPLAQRTGLLDDVLAALLEQGLSLQRKLLASGRLLRMSFPLQVSQLGARGLSRRIRLLMQFHRSAGQGIGFEVNFNGGQPCSALHLENLIRLRMQGCGLCLGEFGDDGGSFQRLCQLPFSEIKISRQFMAELEHQPRHRAVIRACLSLADTLGLSATVTGVENPGQHLILMDLGCGIGQGDYFAPLLKREELLQRFERGLQNRRAER